MTHERTWSSGGMILAGEKQRTGEKNLANCHVVHGKPTQTDLCANSVLGGKNPATVRLSFARPIELYLHYVTLLVEGQTQINTFRNQNLYI
jgi:hypothetical protein